MVNVIVISASWWTLLLTSRTQERPGESSVAPSAEN